MKQPEKLQQRSGVQKQNAEAKDLVGMEKRCDQSPQDATDPSVAQSSLDNSDQPDVETEDVEPDGLTSPDKPKLAGEVNPSEDDAKDEVEPKVVGAWKWVTGKDEVRQLVIEPPTGRPH